MAITANIKSLFKKEITRLGDFKKSLYQSDFFIEKSALKAATV